MPAGKLTPKRRKFVKEYLVDCNGKWAAIRAGYSPKSAGEEAPRLLADVRVQELLEAEKAALAARTDVKQEELVAQLRRRAFSNMHDFVETDENGMRLNLSKVTRDQMAAVQEYTEDTTGGSGDGERKQVVRTKLKLANQDASLELLCRIAGILKDKTEHSGHIDLLNMSDEDLIQRRVALALEIESVK